MVPAPALSLSNRQAVAEIRSAGFRIDFGVSLVSLSGTGFPARQDGWPWSSLHARPYHGDQWAGSALILGDNPDTSSVCHLSDHYNDDPRALPSSYFSRTAE